MDTEKRFGLKKTKATMLFVQMILILFLLVISLYLLVFVISNHLGGWMITSYIFITVSVLAVIYYSTFGYKKGDGIVKMAIHYIDKQKTKGNYPDDIHIVHETFAEEKTCLKFFQEYEERKTAMVCLDFDDLILRTIQI